MKELMEKSRKNDFPKVKFLIDDQTKEYSPVYNFFECNRKFDTKPDQKLKIFCINCSSGVSEKLGLFSFSTQFPLFCSHLITRTFSFLKAKMGPISIISETFVQKIAITSKYGSVTLKNPTKTDELLRLTAIPSIWPSFSLRQTWPFQSLKTSTYKNCCHLN
jgi:hypothetical protein